MLKRNLAYLMPLTICNTITCHKPFVINFLVSYLYGQELPHTFEKLIAIKLHKLSKISNVSKI